MSLGNDIRYLTAVSVSNSLRSDWPGITEFILERILQPIESLLISIVQSLGCIAQQLRVRNHGRKSNFLIANACRNGCLLCLSWNLHTSRLWTRRAALYRLTCCRV